MGWEAGSPVGAVVWVETVDSAAAAAVREVEKAAEVKVVAEKAAEVKVVAAMAVAVRVVVRAA